VLVGSLSTWKGLQKHRPTIAG